MNFSQTVDPSTNLWTEMQYVLRCLARRQFANQKYKQLATGIVL
jgi:hypothetical protein